jgi:hypothetical protein
MQVSNTSSSCTTLTLDTKKDLIDTLNMMRVGEIDHFSMAIFKRLERDVVYDDDIKPTEL